VGVDTDRKLLLPAIEGMFIDSTNNIGAGKDSPLVAVEHPSQCEYYEEKKLD
jgi:hypothetical protein